jgi:hypothetical protein
MLESEERRWIYQHAYLPEHLPDYVAAISGAKPYLHGSYLCFFRGHHLIFIGYPLGTGPEEIARAYDGACERFQPSTAAVIAPRIWFSENAASRQPVDRYYRLDLPLGRADSNLTYMVRRAEKEVRVKVGKFGREHRKLVDEFLNHQRFSPEQANIYKRIRHYLKRSRTARMLEARKADRLIAFTIVDLGSVEYAFYMFSVRSGKDSVPGTSDLLFHEMALLAQVEGKTAINLGLGIHAGIRRFKEKWGGVPFLVHSSAVVHRTSPDLDQLAAKL